MAYIVDFSIKVCDACNDPTSLRRSNFPCNCNNSLLFLCDSLITEHEMRLLKQVLLHRTKAPENDFRPRVLVNKQPTKTKTELCSNFKMTVFSVHFTIFPPKFPEDAAHIAQPGYFPGGLQHPSRLPGA